MALQALKLRKKIDLANKSLEELRAKSEDITKREAELEAAVAEVKTDEDMETVEADADKLAKEKEANDTAVKDLEENIAELERELADIEAKTETAEKVTAEAVVEREVKRPMTKRDKMFGESIVERDAFFGREDVTAWLGEVRTAIKEKRALTNVGLTIPDVFLGVLRQNIEGYSKLYKYVNVKRLNGEGRLVIMGAYPEAVWTEACAWLNELDLSFADVEVGCNKLGGFFAICNAVLEDSDIDLAAEIVTALGQAIGKALDKAILFGTGTKMPLGIYTRLAQETEPAGYPATARPWADLHQTNIKTVASGADSKDIALFQALVINSSAAKGKYSNGTKVWVMNDTTYTYLKAQAMSINAAGAVVTGINSTMPVVGGDVVTLDFIPDNLILGGYFDEYLLAERSSNKFAQSEHYRFLQDQTVFKGTARYDGTPVIAEGFVAIAINGADPSEISVSFEPDDANTVQGITLNKTVATVQATKTVQLKAITSPVEGAVTWASSDDTVATVDESGKVSGVAAGTATITASSNGVVASCALTVTQ